MADCNLQTAERILAEGPDACRAIRMRAHARKILAMLPKLEKAVVRACG